MCAVGNVLVLFCGQGVVVALMSWEWPGARATLTLVNSRKQDFGGILGQRSPDYLFGQRREPDPAGEEEIKWRS